MFNITIKRLSQIVLVITLSLTTHIIWSADVVLFEEDFEDVELKDSVAEAVKGTNVWSDTGPDGWEIINENPEDLGMPEWRTWAIVKLEWWVQTAEDQQRSQFIGEDNGKGMGNGVVSDPDEWDDWTENGDPDSISSWNGHINTPPINIQGAGPNSLVLSLASSWRPYADQTAVITASFDGNEEERILLFASSGEQTLVTIPTLNKNEEVLNDLEQVNETLEIPINNPDGADELVISFGLLTAGNDWWWAFDNVKLISTAFVATDVQLKDKLTVKWAELKSVK